MYSHKYVEDPKISEVNMYRMVGPWKYRAQYWNKNVDIKYSVHDTFLD